MRKIKIISFLIIAIGSLLTHGLLSCNQAPPDSFLNLRIINSFYKNEAPIDSSFFPKIDSIGSILKKNVQTCKGVIYCIGKKAILKKSNFSYEIAYLIEDKNSYYCTKLYFDSLLHCKTNTKKIKGKFSFFVGICDDHYFNLLPTGDNYENTSYSLAFNNKDGMHFVSIAFSDQGTNINSISSRCNRSAIVETIEYINKLFELEYL